MINIWLNRLGSIFFGFLVCSMDQPTMVTDHNALINADNIYAIFIELRLTSLICFVKQ